MRKPLKIGIVVVTVLAVLAGIFMLAGPHIGKYFQQKYYRDTYKPQELEAQVISGFPAEYHIKDIPWISYEKSYCHSISLQMIASKHGVKKPLGYYNFIMGWTYGAAYLGDRFGPYTDPIPGSIAAAPYLGLKMNYLTTNDPDLFINVLRFYLSKEYPVEIQLNAAILWDKKEFLPHSELLVGYDESGFYYFETVIKEEGFTKQAEGLNVTDRILIEAVADGNEEFGRPWKFALTIFEKGEKKEDMSEIWIRNGEGLIGSKFWRMASGAPAIKEFAFDIKESEEIKNLWALEALSYTRLDNTKFLEQYFADDKEIKEAAELLRKAGAYYDKALEIVKGDIKSEKKLAEVTELLIKGADLEEKAGKIFLSKGEALH